MGNVFSMEKDSSHVVINFISPALVVTMPGIISVSLLSSIRSEILMNIGNTRAKTVIFDFSAVDIIDNYEFNSFLSIIYMGKIMGAEAYLVGIKKEVAYTLAQSENSLDEFESAGDIEDAFVKIRNK